MDTDRRAGDVILCSRAREAIVSRARERPSCLAELDGGDGAHSHSWMISGHWDAGSRCCGHRGGG
jgi:hypothetical protein